MLFEKLGDPLSKNEYLRQYSWLIHYVLQQLTFADWENPQIIEDMIKTMFARIATDKGLSVIENNRAHS